MQQSRAAPYSHEARSLEFSRTKPKPTPYIFSLFSFQPRFSRTCVEPHTCNTHGRTASHALTRKGLSLLHPTLGRLASSLCGFFFFKLPGFKQRSSVTCESTINWLTGWRVDQSGCEHDHVELVFWAPGWLRGLECGGIVRSRCA